MKRFISRKIGKTNAQVTELGLGCAGLGELFERVSEEDAQLTLQAAWESGVRYFDTAPLYGYGKSEHRVGTFLRNKPREEFVISTKVGRILKATRDLSTFDKKNWSGGLPFEYVVDFSYDGIMRSFEDSLQRLSLASVDLLIIHDLDFGYHRNELGVNACLTQLYNGGWRALDELRSQGVIQGVGAGINEPGMIPRFLDLVDLDFFLVAYGYNLLSQELFHKEFPLCSEKDVSIVVGAVFATGILATGAIPGARYNYGPAPAEIIAKTNKIAEKCQQHQTPLLAAAMQMLLANPLVSSIIPGALNANHVRSNAAMLQHPIPLQLWDDLKELGLLAIDVPV